MKNVLISILVFASTQPAFSSDDFTDKIICTKVAQPGEADQGLDIIIQSNPTAWIKRAVIVENGYTGPREIGSFQIPLDQPKVSIPSLPTSTRLATYEVRNFILTMEVADKNGQHIKGPAEAHIELPDNDPIDVELICTSVH